MDYKCRHTSAAALSCPAVPRLLTFASVSELLPGLMFFLFPEDNT